MTDPTRENDYRKTRRSWFGELMTEAMTRLFVFAGCILLVGTVVVGGVALHFGISISTAITMVFGIVVLLVLAYGIMNMME